MNQPQALRFGDQGQAVRSLQKQLNSTGAKLVLDGDFGAKTEAAVREFQQVHHLVVDGVAGEKTLATLTGTAARRYLSQLDLLRAASTLSVDLPSIQAINLVESSGSGFASNGRAKVLFERHVFHRQLEHHGFAAQQLSALVMLHPNLVNPATGGYQGGVAEHQRLAHAKQIHREAAYESASYGAFQIMGHHWARLGYASASEMAADMDSSEAAQLEAFVRFIQTDSALHKALKGKKWAEFAKRYNGPNYARNLYDIKLERAYAQFAELAKVAA